jgi:hypothetical protein
MKSNLGKTILSGLLLVVLLVLVACTTTGSGGGQVTGGDKTDRAPVSFRWTSTDGGITGSLAASIAEAQFQGQFFQITQHTRVEALAPLWTHWQRGWYDWQYWGRRWPEPYPPTQFVTHYSGKVVATLEAAGGQRMRCRFHLADPARGMSGGGEGECQLTDGRLISAVFART